MKWNSKEEINSNYVKPTGENKKKILITTKLGLDKSGRIGYYNSISDSF